MTEEEARKLIEPYKFEDVPFYGGVKRYVLHDYDVITLLMEHCKSSKRLEEIRGKIEVEKKKGAIEFARWFTSGDLTTKELFDSYEKFKRSQTKNK